MSFVLLWLITRLRNVLSKKNSWRLHLCFDSVITSDENLIMRSLVFSVINNYLCIRLMKHMFDYVWHLYNRIISKVLAASFSGFYFIKSQYFVYHCGKRHKHRVPSSLSVPLSISWNELWHEHNVLTRRSRLVLTNKYRPSAILTYLLVKFGNAYRVSK